MALTWIGSMAAPTTTRHPLRPRPGTAVDIEVGSEFAGELHTEVAEPAQTLDRHEISGTGG
jgi:hypothetical protein